MKYLMMLVIGFTLMSCQNGMEILAGTTHAKGVLHVEGYFTDTQGEVNLCKVPEAYSVEQAAKFCLGEDIE
jgi:hypothetical protein